jgi:DNA polymerase III epsilon subunit-like protein
MATVYFDLETGGLDGKRHPIIQIAAIAVDAQYNEVEVYERKILFREEGCDPVALKKNNFDPKVWREEGVGPKEVAKEFADFVRRHATLQNISAKGRPYTSCQMAGHNASVFDRKFLGDWYDRLGGYCPADWRVLDTMQLALWYYFVNQKPRPENFQLETLCAEFGVELEGDAHDALVDVRATVALGQALSKKGR